MTGADGRWYILKEGEEPVPQVPFHIDLGQIPCLVSISDQGPSNMAAINYLLFSKQAMLFWAVYDPFHRAWNDLKLALKKVHWGAWRVILEMTLVANLNYGPFGSSGWFFKKRAKLEDFLATNDSNCEAWQKYQHLICQERRIPEPANFFDAQDMFQSLTNLETFNTKGPLIKLMRWFSFFESMVFHQGEMFCTKMILEHGSGMEEVKSEAEVKEDLLPKAKDDRQELAELKKRKGTWKLAPELITSRALCIKDIVLSVGKATWHHFSEMARELRSPDHVLEYNISCSNSTFWVAELLEMVNTSLADPRFLSHILPRYRGHEKALEWQCDLFDKLVETRAKSLAAFHILPPNLYCHLLHPDQGTARTAHQLALAHFKVLLEAEEALCGGVEVKPLGVMYWRWNPLIRCLFLALEDERTHSFFTAQSRAHRLMLVLSKHLGRFQSD